MSPPRKCLHCGTWLQSEFGICSEGLTELFPFSEFVDDASISNLAAVPLRPRRVPELDPPQRSHSSLTHRHRPTSPGGVL